MAEIGGWQFEGQSDRLFMHFDVQGHFLKLDTFIKTADSARRVIEALDQTFFQGSLEYELIVLPPEDGTFLSKLAFVCGSLAAVATFLDSDVGGAYVEGLTGYPPSYWAIATGEATRSLINNASKLLEKDQEDEVTSLKSPEPLSSEDAAACQATSKIVVALARGVLERSTDQLNKIGMEFGSLPDAMDARADFYAACLENRDVKRVGFTPDDDFPIPRSSFPERAQKPARKEKEDAPLPWVVSVESIYVTSPNWDEEDQKTRQWKGKDQLRRDCYFVIEDAEFWFLVRRKDLHVEVLDNLKVQWACQIVDGRPRNRRVLRVLEFNGDKLAEPLTDEAIRSIVGEHLPEEAPPRQTTLFDEWPP